MYADFRKMRFAINGKSIDGTLIATLINGAKQCKFGKVWNDHREDKKVPDHKKTDQYFESFYNIGIKYTNLLPKEDKNKNYRTFVKEILKKMFKDVGAKAPSDHIPEELITNYNQAGYEFICAPFICELSNKYGLHMDVNSSNVNRRVLIDREKIQIL
ncbi:hypothetical protein EJB10_00825 [Wolbachia endosymbiont of Brugia malayi]|uniref:hypothetical protein n=1 Tax=Wolbachia endosymbiont of Brugia malayi TaxID=80849 RepID=UPI00031E2C18|nr:hypothetical protein [Wolbachia endosymbiont of Brugia malayi]QCB61418.1 hypothetical protein EJB10_00825 [Wolbachia endosymbiont of Brugia malayi]